MKRALVTIFATVTLIAVGCATPRTQAPLDLAPRSLMEIERSSQLRRTDAARPIVALALGGGGLRGFAHIGVLRALEEAAIKPDFVVGTSAGSLVGAAYASGMTASEIEAAALNVKVLSLIDWNLNSSGLMRGDNLSSWIETLTRGARIETFPIRYAAVATDLESGQAVVIDRGSAGTAIRASAAVPGMQAPVAYAGGHLVDGGIASLVPVRAARALGADIVIAVDIYCHGPRAEGLGALKVVGRAMQTQNCLVAAPEMAEADVLIAPRVGVPGMTAKDEQRRAIQAGYEAARAALLSAGMKHQLRRISLRTPD